MAETTGSLITFAVICKNEAMNIERCLESVVREAAGVEGGGEILVVDSFSTDATVELALRFPVTVVQLGREWPHSPAAGRYTAVRHARGRFLMVIDADMELLPGFIHAALHKLAVDPELVAVRGALHNFHVVHGDTRYLNSDLGGRQVVLPARDEYQVERVLEVATGAALYRREALLQVGNFHPFLKAEEEFEVAQRLRECHWKFLYIPVDAVNHYGYLPDPIDEVKRRLRGGLIGGIGQMVRLSFQEGFGAENLFRFKRQLGAAMFFLLFVPSLLLVPVYPAGLVAWITLFVLLLTAYLVKKGSFRHAVAACMLNVLIGLDIIRGIGIPVPPKESYPKDVLLIPGGGAQKEHES